MARHAATQIEPGVLTIPKSACLSYEKNSLDDKVGHRLYMNSSLCSGEDCLVMGTVSPNLGYDRGRSFVKDTSTIKDSCTFD